MTPNGAVNVVVSACIWSITWASLSILGPKSESRPCEDYEMRIVRKETSLPASAVGAGSAASFPSIDGASAASTRPSPSRLPMIRPLPRVPLVLLMMRMETRKPNGQGTARLPSESCRSHDYARRLVMLIMPCLISRLFSRTTLSCPCIDDGALSVCR